MEKKDITYEWTRGLNRIIMNSSYSSPVSLLNYVIPLFGGDHEHSEHFNEWLDDENAGRIWDIWIDVYSA